ncbi:hypothetical protein V1520DRAFT_284664 [Lipomyces starkeyi]|uniref:Uncharacterized protein n=1 Tax=Lipomyces starkeyi NRRL Y-11557 TaxID=675824 RepID=A0A1E3PYM4_LIPST|nr:hypothetical protein LIPSTDRAFT_65730 [Lipomyces starkeyi NRRL Y-11557]
MGNKRMALSPLFLCVLATTVDIKIEDKFKVTESLAGQWLLERMRQNMFAPEEERRYLRMLDIRLVSLLSANTYLCPWHSRAVRCLRAEEEPQRNHSRPMVRYYLQCGYCTQEEDYRKDVLVP